MQDVVFIFQKYSFDQHISPPKISLSILLHLLWSRIPTPSLNIWVGFGQIPLRSKPKLQGGPKPKLQGGPKPKLQGVDSQLAYDSQVWDWRMEGRWYGDVIWWPFGGLKEKERDSTSTSTSTNTPKYSNVFSKNDSSQFLAFIACDPLKVIIFHSAHFLQSSYSKIPHRQKNRFW